MKKQLRDGRELEVVAVGVNTYKVMVAGALYNTGGMRELNPAEKAKYGMEYGVGKVAISAAEHDQVVAENEYLQYDIAVAQLMGEVAANDAAIERAHCSESAPALPQRISVDARMAEIRARYPKAAADARKSRPLTNEEIWNA